MRKAFRMILETAGVEVVGEAGDGDQAVAVAQRERPDVVMMDVRMPGRDGLSATAEVVATLPDVRVLVLTTFDLDDYLYGALRAGAAGFVLKNAEPEEVVRAVRAVAAGDAVLDPAVTARVLARVSLPGPSDGTAGQLLAALTEREKDVLRLLAEGRTNPEIAAALAMGEATVKTHVSRVLMKLGVRDRVQAAIWAHRAGFV